MAAARRARSGSCSRTCRRSTDICRAILTPKPLAVVLTAYSIRASFFAIHALMRDTFAGMGGTVESGELVIREKVGRPRAVDLAVLALGGGMNEHSAHAGAPGQVKEVTSLANPLVKDIKALALKKFRDQQNAFMAEGLKLVIDALDLGWSIRTLVFAKSGARQSGGREGRRAHGRRRRHWCSKSREGAVGHHPARQSADGGRRLRAEVRCR